MLVHDDALWMRAGALYSGNRTGTPEGPGKFLQYGGQGAFVVTPDGNLSTGVLWRDGSFAAGAFPVYNRSRTADKFRPPYVAGGRIRVWERLSTQFNETSQSHGSYDRTVCFQPELIGPETTYVHPMWGSTGTLHRPSFSAKRDNVYASSIPGWPEYEVNWRTDIDPWQRGRWYDWSMEVADHGHHLLRINGQLIQEVKVKEPLHREAAHFGLRLDFYHVELAGTYVMPLERTVMHTINQPMRAVDPVRIYDSRRTEPTHLRENSAVVVTAPAPLRRSSALLVNVTLIDALSPGYATLWPSGPMPEASVQNHPGGRHAVAGSTIVRLDEGQFRLFTSMPCHVAVDVVAAW